MIAKLTMDAGRGAASEPLNISFLTERSGDQESIILLLLAKYGLAALTAFA